MAHSAKQPLAVAVLALALGCGLAGSAVSCRRAAPPRPPAPRVDPPPAPRPVPQALEDAHREIRKLQATGKYEEAAQRYLPFLGRLAQDWGESHPDLASYHYDFALALKLASRARECVAVASEALRRWPDSLQLEVLAATARAEAALLRGGSSPEADAAFRRILREENFPRLRGLRVEPAALFTQWAELLLRAARPAEALAAVEGALRLDPRQARARAVKGRTLLALQRAAEALPLLEEALRERAAPELDFSVAVAQLECGDAGRAWERFSRLLEAGPAAAEGSPAADPVLPHLRVQAARALNQLGRPREAAELLLEELALEPENVEALHPLAAAARALGARGGMEAVNLRIRRVYPRDRRVIEARQARAAGHESSAAYFEARAALEVGRCGESLERLQDAIRLAPRLAELHHEMARVRLLLGRLDLAEHALREGLRAAGSPLLEAGLARVAALRGKPAEARRILDSIPPAASARAAGPAEGGLAGRGAGLLPLRRAGTWLELGDPAAARSCLDGMSPEDAEAAGGSEGRLLRAELALAEGRTGEARALLEESFDELPGGSAWAGALRAVIDGIAGDPSDLLDHPRLLEGAAYRPPEGPGLESVRALGHRRRALLSRMEGRPDRDLLPEWLELLALYREAGALRKEREAAWYLVQQRPGGVEEHRRLASALSAAEETVARLAVLRRARRLAPGDPALEEAWAKARAFLGLGPP